ncbi:hypothetical protein O181_031218 [Austropuccinia psidii MF-1]|uniref:Uncharacterized protein n=1 Tax=Austropuccinia psidii MF-1 TaxID=1389203 RepID=A0A9Q3CZ80_9BASI|nr:hypothetical protein [Austropuccinia psidii MF-1]
MDNKSFKLASNLAELGEFFQNEIQTPGGKGTQDKGESSHYPSYRITTEPERAYSDSFSLTMSRPTQLSSGFTPLRNQKISGQDSPFFTIPGTFHERTRIKGQEKELFQPKAERVRTNYKEAVGLGERSPQGPKIVANTFNGIRTPAATNITLTKMEHSVVTPESNINSH